MNKKTYIAPQVDIVTVDTISMMAASPNIGIVKGEENGGEEILSNDRRGSWGNLWN